MQNEITLNGETSSRWVEIEKALLGNFESSLDFEVRARFFSQVRESARGSHVPFQSAVRSYNPGQRWSFGGLHRFLGADYLSRSELSELLTTVLPATARLALRLPELLTQPLPLLRAGSERSVSLSQAQAASLLANALFSTFPRRNFRSPQAEYADYNRINFAELYGKKSDVGMAKWRCLFHYFRSVTASLPTGALTFSRRCLPPSQCPDWKSSEKRLPALHVAQLGTIEDDGAGMSQMDFANKYLGGGVLGHGCVQEEIRFLVCPELLLSCLLAERLGDQESLVMTGCQRFSDYSGYSDSFRWAGHHQDVTPTDAWGRRMVEVVAIDAILFHSHRVQFMPRLVERELRKALVGFRDREGAGVAVATGNWGCGAFGGDVQLKSVVQLMAAAEAGREVAYFTFHDGRFMEQLAVLHQLLTEKSVTVGMAGSLSPGTRSSTAEVCRAAVVAAAWLLRDGSGRLGAWPTENFALRFSPRSAGLMS